MAAHLHTSNTCPYCRKSFAENSNFMPFCCERCKLLDLGEWAHERYAIPTQERPQAENGVQNTAVEEQE